MRKFRLTGQAAGDITEIFDYLAESSVEAALRVSAEIYEEAKDSPTILAWDISGKT